MCLERSGRWGNSWKFQRSLHLGRIVAFLIVPVFRGGTWQRRHVAEIRHYSSRSHRRPESFLTSLWSQCSASASDRPLEVTEKCQLQHWWSQQLRHKFKMIKKSSVQEYHEISWNKMKCVFYVFGAVPQRTCPDMKTGNFNSFASNVKSNLPLKSIEIHVPSIDKLVNWRGMHQKRARRTCHHHRPSPSC